MTAAVQPALTDPDAPVLMALASYEPVRIVPTDVLTRLATTCSTCRLHAAACACPTFRPAVKRLA